MHQTGAESLGNFWLTANQSEAQMTTWAGVWSVRGGSSLYLFISFNFSFVSAWTYILYFCSKWMLFYLFCCSNCSSIWSLGTLSLGSCFLLTYPHPREALLPFFFFCISELSGTVRCSRLILYIFCPSLRTSHFSKESWFLLWVKGIRNQDLVAKCACCYWGIVASRSSLLME